MMIKHVLLVPAALACFTVAACGSNNSSTDTTTSADSAAPAAATCPSAKPAAGTAAEWTVHGTTGSAEVTGSTDTAAPQITVKTPFSVAQTTVQTLKPGTGAVVSDTATVSVCYMGVDGRTGKVFDSSYERATPADFPLGGVVPGFKKAIAGQKVGSTVGVAMTSADGYPDGQPDAGIDKGDTLVFAIKILSAQG